MYSKEIFNRTLIAALIADSEGFEGTALALIDIAIGILREETALMAFDRQGISQHNIAAKLRAS